MANGKGRLKCPHKPQRLAIALLGICCAISVLGLAKAQTFGSIGTLTCTAEPSEAATGAFKLQCQFSSTSGADGSFEGQMTMEGPAALLSKPGRRVLVWSVVSHEKVDLTALDGSYHSETAGKSDAGLVGGREASIRLEPVTAGAQPELSLVPKTLSIKLTATKT